MSIPATMTATVLVAPHRFELQERPVPAPGDEDVLVRVRGLRRLRDGSEDHPPGHAADAPLR